MKRRRIWVLELVRKREKKEKKEEFGYCIAWWMDTHTYVEIDIGIDA